MCSYFGHIFLQQQIDFLAWSGYEGAVKFIYKKFKSSSRATQYQNKGSLSFLLIEPIFCILLLFYYFIISGAIFASKISCFEKWWNNLWSRKDSITKYENHPLFYYPSIILPKIAEKLSVKRSTEEPKSLHCGLNNSSINNNSGNDTTSACEKYRKYSSLFEWRISLAKQQYQY